MCVCACVWQREKDRQTDRESEQLGRKGGKQWKKRKREPTKGGGEKEIERLTTKGEGKNREKEKGRERAKEKGKDR